jgi:membrane fusion protein, multidrug efflux system
LMNNGAGKLALWVTAGLVVAAGVYLNWFTDTQGPDRGRFGAGMAISVRAEPARTMRFSDVLEAIGTSRANESVVIASRVSETVESVNFTDGAVVEKGTILVRLIQAEEAAQVEEGEANVRDAESQYARILDLEIQGNASQSLLDTRLRELESARSRLSQARARLEDRLIRAPFSGILGLRNISPGALVSPGSEITTLDDIDIIKIDFSIPERFLSTLAPGQLIETEAAAFPGEVFSGRVMTVDTRVDPVTRAVAVRAVVENQDHRLLPGMLMSIELESNERVSVAVPSVAIIPVGRENFVYIVEEDNKVRRASLDVGVRREGFTEVISGVSVGDVVANSGLMRLSPGANVRVLGDSDVSEDMAELDEAASQGSAQGIAENNE